jgi:hypothetical protein
VAFDEVVPHDDSPAKKAVAFFNWYEREHEADPARDHLAGGLGTRSHAYAGHGTRRSTTSVVEAEPIRLGAGREILWASSPIF